MAAGESLRQGGGAVFLMEHRSAFRCWIYRGLAVELTPLTAFFFGGGRGGSTPSAHRVTVTVAAYG